MQVPQVVCKTRVRDESIGGLNPYRWQDVCSESVFAGKRIAVFARPSPEGIRLLLCLQRACDPSWPCAARGWHHAWSPQRKARVAARSARLTFFAARFSSSVLVGFFFWSFLRS